jgi:hypothetical protein
MTNDNIQPMSEETAKHLADAFVEAQKSASELHEKCIEAANKVLQLIYMDTIIMMKSAKASEQMYAELINRNLLYRLYYRRKYIKARKWRIACERGIIHSRIINKSNEELIAEFDKIDHMYL